MRRLVDAGTRGRENVGTGGRETVQGLGYVGRRYSIFALNLQSTIFGALEKGIICWRVC